MRGSEFPGAGESANIPALTGTQCGFEAASGHLRKRGMSKESKEFKKEKKAAKKAAKKAGKKAPKNAKVDRRDMSTKNTPFSS